MEAVLDPYEVGAGVLGLFIESTTSEHLVAPFRYLNDTQASRQPEIGWRCAASFIGAVCEGGQGELLPIGQLARCDANPGTVDGNDHA